MNPNLLNLTTRLLGVGLALGGLMPLAANAEATADRVVSALEETFGVTPGQRRNQIKETCAAGEFVGTAEGAALSRSALFSGKPIPVVARFSLAGGNPKVPDTAKSPRGMALEFQLPDGGRQHMTMLNTPMFGAAHPQTFLDQMVATKPDPETGKPDPEKVKAFKASHPDNLAQAEYLAGHNPPASYTTSSYFGIHSFKFIDRDDKTTLVRWRFVPQDGEKRLSDAELAAAPANFLEPALIERVGQGAVLWDMVLTIGAPGDPEDDPTQAWPKGRQELKVRDPEYSLG
ncbi:MAG: catalase family peroxidase [Chromatiaceae bacterium]